MEIIGKYFNDLSPEQADRFKGLEPLYLSWNEKVNVISRKDIANLYIHHVLHSLAIARFVSFAPGAVVLDAGTGGGFPGIPLAIMFPESRFILVDSTGKKLMVVKDVADKLGLENCDVIHGRVEELKVRADFLVSRAVTSMQEIVKWGHRIVYPGKNSSMPNGLVVLKGGDLQEELKGSEGKAIVREIWDMFPEDYFKTKKLIYMPVR